jgi:hypothetical protein
MEPIIANEFDITKVAYGIPRTLDSGAKHIRISYKKGPFIVQTPDMIAPFGMNRWENPGSAAKHSIELSFKDIEDRPELQEFKAMIKALDDKFVNDVFNGVLPTHQKKFTSRDVVDVLYQPMFKIAKDEKFPPNFKITLPVGEKEEFNFPTYTMDKSRVPRLTDLKQVQTKGAVCTVIMQCVGIWVAGGSNFGCTWKATQLRVQPPVSKTDYAFKNVKGLLDVAPEEDMTEHNMTTNEDDDAAADLENRIKAEDVAEGVDDLEMPVV